VKIILLGPPGAGKGTQAKSISSKYEVPHISTGDIFRKHIAKLTPLGVQAKKFIDKGQLVPDELTIDIVKHRLVKDDCSGGFLLDGFPRTVKQAEALDIFLSEAGSEVDKAVFIEVPKGFIIDRMTGRRVCLTCGASYHIKYNPPRISDRCDTCGSDLIQRKDDEISTVSERLDVYDKQTQPLIKYYRDKNVLATVDGTKPINDVFKNINGILGSDK